jgi:multidrug efflux system membrane fusion protein
MDDLVTKSDAAPLREREPLTREARRPRLWRPAAALLLIGAGLLLWLHPWQHKPPHPAGPPPGALAQSIGEAVVTSGDLPVWLEGIGTVTPWTTVNIQTEISGLVMEVGFHEGQLVKKGDFLVQIDPRPYQILLEQYQAQLAHDQALLAEAKMDYIRYQGLNKQNSIARQTAEDQAYLVKQYEGTVKVDQSNIDNQKLNLIYCHITSPVDGRVGIRRVDPGNFLTASGLTTITVVTQMQPMTVIFVLPEDVVQRVMSQPNNGTGLRVDAYDRSDTKRLASGTLLGVGSQIDTTTGTFNLRANFENRNTELFPFQFVNAHILIDTLHHATIVPKAALQKGVPGNYVFVVRADHTVAVRPVTLGEADGERVAVLSGLAPGEHVVVDGADRLRDGAHVRVIGEHAAAARP